MRLDTTDYYTRPAQNRRPSKTYIVGGSAVAPVYDGSQVRRAIKNSLEASKARRFATSATIPTRGIDAMTKADIAHVSNVVRYGIEA